jgi:hypothetical protein
MMMTFKVLFLALTLLSFSNSWANSSCTSFLSQDLLEPQIKTEIPAVSDDSASVLFQYATTWSNRRNVSPESQHQVNGFLIESVTEYFLNHKKLPSENELEAAVFLQFSANSKGFAEKIMNEGLKKYFKIEGSPKSVFDIAFVAITDARRQKFFPFKDELRADMMKFFLTRLRPPTLKELAEIKKLDEPLLSLFIPNPTNFIKKAIDSNPEVITSVRDKLMNVYFRALGQKDIEESKRTQPTSPTIENLFVALRALKISPEITKDIESGVFKIEHLRDLIDPQAFAQSTSANSDESNSQSWIRIPVFDNLKAIEILARQQRPAAFKNFIPAEVYNPERTTSLLNALKEKQGFLITSVNAGQPINEAMYISMLKYAKEKNYDLIIIPTGGILDGLDSRLLEQPNIHILTHTIQNKFIRLWNIPVLPKNQNGLASLSNPKQHSPMQLTIVGHPAIQHLNVPTATNHQRATSIWSTGSLSQDTYPYRHAVQGRTSALAKNQHTHGFLVVEKADGESGFDKEGVANFWHTRPIYFADDFNTETNTAGFTDKGVKYAVKESDRYNLQSVKKSSLSIDTLVLGDLHARLADNNFLDSVKKFILDNPEIKRIVLHDPIDGGSHNRHEAKSIPLLRKKFARGEMDYHKEMMGVVQVINALTSIRTDLNIVVADSNHSYWGQQLLSGSTDFQEIANGKFLTELRFAQSIHGFSDPLEYVLKHRNDMIEGLPLAARIEMLKTAILVENPEQIIVLPFGRNYVVGPEHRQTHINFHGHQGSNGARPSPKTHASGSESAITGDSHQSYILGNWMSVGTSTPLQVGYNDGGYSAWSNSMAAVYADGTKQLFTYSSETGTFMARDNTVKMSESEFFGREDLEILVNDNDVVSTAIVDQNTHIINALSESGLKKRK